MLDSSNSNILLLSILTISLILTFYFLVGFFYRVRKLKLLGASGKLTNTLIFGLLSTSLSFFLLGISGYHSLTYEELLAEIEITPIEQQKFKAILRYKDGTELDFELLGDEIEIQANILKWKSWSNILGLRTSYRLDRVVGRYSKLSDEKNKKRSVYSLTDENKLDIASWRKQYEYLNFLLDVEHGSASFVSAEKSQKYNLVVTNDGLMLRPKKRH
ncbi:MAG: hypothetical protein ACJAS9_003174 [Polaribacter sp.]|jgi:hypothetical protein